MSALADHAVRLTSLSPGAGCACKLPLLHDAQTSGGLLLAAAEDSGLLAELGNRGVPAAVIGRAVDGDGGRITVGATSTSPRRAGAG